MNRQLPIVIAAAAFAFAALAPDLASAQFDDPTFPNCWHGAWNGFSSGSTARTCSNALAGIPINATVRNAVRHNFTSRWRTAVMQRTNECNLGNAILWINSNEVRLSDGVSGPWWWRSTNTIKNCSFVLTRNAFSDNGQVIVNSRCRVELCNEPH